jgi:hypothetical protein
MLKATNVEAYAWLGKPHGPCVAGLSKKATK